MKILVCDDDSVMRTLVSTMLDPLGHQVEFACDGQQALESIQATQNSFDMLITDNMMPRIGGVELVAKLRALNLPLKIVMITGFRNHLDAEVYGRLELDGLLTKPFTRTELLDCLEKRSG